MSLSVLFLGLGGVGQRHLRNLRHLRPEARVAAVRHVGRRFEIKPDLNADAGTDIVEKYGITVYSDMATALREFRPDCAVVASPTSAHAAQAAELLAAGIPLLLEKPACQDDAELDRLLAAQAAGGAMVMVAYMLRFNPSVVRLRRWVAERRLGKVTGIDVEANSYLPAWHPYESFKDFYAGRKDLGGGAILTEIHLVDLLGAMFGAPRRLWSVGGALSPHGLEVEDSVASLLEYQLDGRVLGATVNVSFMQRPVRHAITVKCEQGRLVWTLADNKVVAEDCGAGVVDSFTAAGFERNQMFVDELAHFLACLESGAEPESSLAQAAAGQRIANAMRRSLAEGGPIVL